MGDNFIDVDAFTVGQVVPPLQFLFDRYWNSAPVYPLEAVAKSKLSTAELREQFDRATSPEATPAAGCIAAERHPRLRADLGRPRRRPARPDLGRGLRVRRPSRQAVRGPVRRRAARDQRDLQRVRGDEEGAEGSRRVVAVLSCPGRTGWRSCAACAIAASPSA
jgi:hypothetical protein